MNTSQSRADLAYRRLGAFWRESSDGAGGGHTENMLGLTRLGVGTVTMVGGRSAGSALAGKLIYSILATSDSATLILSPT